MFRKWGIDVFKYKLKAALKERGMTQTELAIAAGLSNSGISQYLSGKVTPPDKVKQKLGEVLGVSFDEPVEPVDYNEVSYAEKCITPEQAAKILGQSKNTVRLALQQGRAPFGYACKGTGNRWCYHISAKKLYEYTVPLT